MQTKEVEFYGDKLIGVKGDDGKILVNLRQVVENLGLNYATQYRKVVSNPILNKGVVIMTMPSAGGNQDALCFPAEMIPGYLLTLNVNKISAELQPKIMRYAEEAYKVLAEVFMGPGFATNPDPLRVDTGAMKARSEEIALKRHQMMQDTVIQLQELDPNYSRATLSRMLELSARTNLQGELVQERVVLDVGAFLKEQGVKQKEARSMGIRFGKALKKAYHQIHGKNPQMHTRFVDGAERKVCAYTEEHRGLMEEVYQNEFQAPDKPPEGWFGFRAGKVVSPR